MNFLKKTSIASKIILIVLTISILTTTISAVAYYYYEMTLYKKKLYQYTKANAKLISEYCVVPMTFDDVQKTKEFLNITLKDSFITDIVVFKQDKSIFAEIHKNNIFNNHFNDYAELSEVDDISTFLYVLEPIQYQKDVIGFLALKVQTNVKQIQQERIIFAIEIVLIVSLIAVLLAYLMQRLVTSSIQNLTIFTSQISEKNNYQLRIKKQSEDEIGTLYDEFNNLLDKVHFHEVLLRNEKERAETYLNLVQVIIVVIDLNKKILLLNKKGIELLGYEKNEINNKYWFDFVDNSEDDFSSKEYDYYESKVITKSGELRLVAWQNKFIKNEEGRIIGTICSGEDITEKRKSETLLKEREEIYHQLYESMLDAYVKVDEKGNFLEFNQAYIELTGYSREELYNMSYKTITPSKWEQIEKYYAEDQVLERGYSDIYEKEYIHKSGKIIPVELRNYKAKTNTDKFEVWAIVKDISERKKAEAEKEALKAQLDNIQKLESIGRLAGGVAHDFNNMLTPILGYTELLQIQLENDEPKLNKINQIIKAVHRAKDLVNQLLAFARKQSLELKPIELNNIITDILPMLQRTLRENIILECNLSAKENTILADSSKIEQIIMNLVVNAQDAMPNGGKLSITTQEVYIDKYFDLMHDNIVEGEYVQFSVSDTGVGMSKEVQQKVFEPFFTTKEFGKGTGLGLPTLYGIVSQLNGYVWLYSEVGIGTTFKIYIPKISTRIQEASKDNNTSFSVFNKGSEHILLVEDEDIVRDMAKEILRSYNYKVVSAANFESAIDIFKHAKNPFDLLITDVILPDKNGRDLYNEIKKINPDIKVLFMSGYTSNVISNDDVINEEVNFIQKPFSLKIFLNKVREALELEKV